MWLVWPRCCPLGSPRAVRFNVALDWSGDYPLIEYTLDRGERFFYVFSELWRGACFEVGRECCGGSFRNPACSDSCGLVNLSLESVIPVGEDKGEALRRLENWFLPGRELLEAQILSHEVMALALAMEEANGARGHNFARRRYAGLVQDLDRYCRAVADELI